MSTLGIAFFTTTMLGVMRRSF